jgi:hypothetical protein
MTVPAVVYNTRHDLVASNLAGRALFAPRYDAEQPNFARFIFLDSRAQDFYPDSERPPPTPTTDPVPTHRRSRPSHERADVLDQQLAEDRRVAEVGCEDGVDGQQCVNQSGRFGST